MKYEMDEGALRWALKTARKNFWRVQRWYDFDDLVQDGHMCWCIVVDKYLGSATERCAHLPKAEDRTRELLMSLFMRTYTNHIHDLATKKTRCPDIVMSEMLKSDDDERLVVEKAFAESAVCDAHARAVVTRAPAGVREVLTAYASESNAARSTFRVRNGVRETVNDRLCRIARTEPTVDLVSQVKSYLSADLRDNLDLLEDFVYNLAKGKTA